MAGYEKKLNKKARFNTFILRKRFTIFNKKLIYFLPEFNFNLNALFDFFKIM